MSKSNDGWTIAAVIGGFVLFCIAVSGNSSGGGNPDYYDGPQPHCYGDYRLGEC